MICKTLLITASIIGFDLHPLEKIVTPPYKEGDQDDVPAISKLIHDMPQMPTAEWAKKSGKWKEIVQAYLACVSFVDHNVGRLLRQLEKSPYANNTIVVLWSDHGYHLGEKNRFCKHGLWEEATNSPLIVAAPNGKSQVCPQPVQLLDIYPTLIDLCGLPKYGKLEGHSLVPLLNDGSKMWKFPAITTYSKNNHSIRTERYRYIVYEDGSEELYDHTNDDNEWNNLANQERFKQIKKELRNYIPTKNADWTKHSFYTANDFMKQKMAEKKEKRK